jgi:kynurenine formamidase
MTEPNGAAEALSALKAASLVKTGEIIRLDHELTNHLPTRQPPVLRRTEHHRLRRLDDGRHAVITDDVVELALQGSSHWDALGHVGVLAEDTSAVYYGGHPITSTAPGPAPAGLDAASIAPVFCRGILVDVIPELGNERGFVPDGASVSQEVVRRAMKRESVSVEPGDVVLFYTGFERRVIESDSFPAVSPGLDASTLELWSGSGVRALVADNIGVEAFPADLSIHIGVMGKHGIHLGEYWNLETLAERCRARQSWEFCLASVPLNLPGAYGSPANAIAIL